MRTVNQNTLQQLINQLNNNSRAQTTKRIGDIGALLGFVASIYLGVLGGKFAKRRHWPTPAVIFYALLTGTPLSITFSKKTRDQFMKWQTKLPDSWKEWSKTVGVALLSLTVTIPITALSHEEIKSIPEIGTQGVAIASDALVFLTRILLFHWSINTSLSRITAFAHQVNNRRQFTALPDPAKKIYLIDRQLEKTERLLKGLTDSDIELIFTTIRSADKWNSEAIPELLKLTTDYSHTQPHGDIIPSIRGITAALISLASTNTMRELSLEVFTNQFQFLGMSLQTSSGLAMPLSLLAMLMFSTFVGYAVDFAFDKFFFGITHISHSLRGRGNNISSADAIFASLIMAISSCSSTPRIELNTELYRDYPLGWKILLNSARAISWFALDFWPLMKLKELIFKSANHRDTLLALVTKLRALLPTLNEDYIDDICALIPEPDIPYRHSLNFLSEPRQPLLPDPYQELTTLDREKGPTLR
ncbi:putative membrane spanning protein [Coxiella burnetii str. Namibia]|nr:putative membrane spanning protein [Coxiella burnetii str. Namibia]